MKNRITTLLILSLSLVLSGCSVSAKQPLQYQPDSELVVLAHGLGRNDIAMWRLTQRLEDAGLVSAESTKLDNMTDFIEIEVGHSNMRCNGEVAEQTIYFLQHGHFENKLTSVKP